MVFIIKSNGAARTCRIPERTSTSAMLEEVAQALKGLTFKIEVKIVDVVQNKEKSSDEVEQPTPTKPPQVPPQPEQPKAPVVSKPTVVEPAPPRVPQQQPAQPAVQTIPKSIEKPTPAPSAAPSMPEPVPKPVAKFPPTVGSSSMMPPQVKLTSGVPKVIATASEISEPNKAPRVYEAPLEPVRKKLGKPLDIDSTPKLIKGGIKLGTTVKTCCIAVDDKAQPPIAFISYDDSKLMKIVEIINELSDSIESQPIMTTFNNGDIVFAKSADDNQWYRAMIETIEDDAVEVYFFDWGLHEKLDPTRVRHMICPDLGLASFPACAVKLELLAPSQDIIQEVLKCESNFALRIDSYDDFSETYKTTILGPVET